jgi:hypothetical protein
MIDKQLLDTFCLLIRKETPETSSTLNHDHLSKQGRILLALLHLETLTLKREVGWRSWKEKRGCETSVNIHKAPLLIHVTRNSLQSLTRVHAVQSLLEVLQVKDVGDHSLDIQLSAVEVLNGSTETVELGEGSDNIDLIVEDPGGGPVNPGLVGVNTVDHEGTSSSDVVDRSVDEGLDTGTLDNTVESVRVVLLDLLPLSLGLLTTSPLEPDVLVTTVELFGNVHLHTVVSGNDDLGSTVQLEQLSHAETGGTGTEQEDLGSDLGLELVESVDGTRGGFEQGSLLVRDVGVLEDLGLVATSQTKRIQVSNRFSHLHLDPSDHRRKRTH